MTTKTKKNSKIIKKNFKNYLKVFLQNFFEFSKFSPPKLSKKSKNYLYLSKTKIARLKLSLDKLL